MNNYSFTLFHYWRSSCSWRVRWVLELKKLKFECIPVDLLKEENESQEYRNINPTGFVPSLKIGDFILSESIAICEWLDETFPTPALFPENKLDRARVRQLVFVIACGIQPVQNLGPAQMYAPDSAEKRLSWSAHWIREGLFSYQEIALKSSGRYSFGNSVTMADIFLIPQCYNALRNQISLEQEFPMIHRIFLNALDTPECQASHPDRYIPESVVTP